MPLFVIQLSTIGLLSLTAFIGGLLAKYVKLPPLIGMLLAGLAIRNAPGDLLQDLPQSWSVTLRLLALAVILLRAGLGLDLRALAKLRTDFLRLAAFPNLTETATVAIASYFLLGLPPTWSLLLGFVVAAVSPAVVVPSILDLQSRGYGERKGIPTMILAAASFDDVLSITGFGVTLSLIFAGRGEASALESLLQAPLELGLGLGFGVAAGYVCVAAKRAPSWVRFTLLLGFGLLAVFGGWAIGLTGGGSLAAMSMGAIAARGWDEVTVPVAALMGRVWTVAQPLLFGLIGAAVALTSVESAYVARGVAILSIGLVVRFLVTFLSTSSNLFTKQERLFVAVAWIPKATVQAAIGALALDLAREYNAGAEAETYGIQVVTVAVLAIIITAPIGAAAIAWTGPRWLER